jgi:hypothetical protein
MTPGFALVGTGVVTAATGVLGFPTDLAVLLPAGLVQVALGVATRTSPSVARGLLASAAALPSVLIGAALLARFPLFGAAWSMSAPGVVVAWMLVGAGAAPAITTLLTLRQRSSEFDG